MRLLDLPDDLLCKVLEHTAVARMATRPGPGIGTYSRFAGYYIGAMGQLLTVSKRFSTGTIRALESYVMLRNRPAHERWVDEVLRNPERAARTKWLIYSAHWMDIADPGRMFEVMLLLRHMKALVVLELPTMQQGASLVTQRGLYSAFEHLQPLRHVIMEAGHAGARSASEKLSFLRNAGQLQSLTLNWVAREFQNNHYSGPIGPADADQWTPPAPSGELDGLAGLRDFRLRVQITGPSIGTISALFTTITSLVSLDLELIEPDHAVLRMILKSQAGTLQIIRLVSRRRDGMTMGFDKVTAALARCQGLRSLSVDPTSLIDVRGLADLPNLVDLSLVNRRPSTWTKLAGLVKNQLNLRRLSIRYSYDETLDVDVSDTESEGSDVPRKKKTTVVLPVGGPVHVWGSTASDTDADDVVEDVPCADPSCWSHGNAHKYPKKIRGIFTRIAVRGI